MDQVILTIGDYALLLSDLLRFLVNALIICLIYFFVLKKYIPVVFRETKITTNQQKRLKRIIGFFLLALLIVAAIVNLKIHFNFFNRGYNEQLNIRSLAIGFLVIQSARLIDWVFSNIFIHNFFTKRDELHANQGLRKKDTESSAIRIAQYIVYVVAIIFLLRVFNWDFHLYPETINGKTVNLKISSIIMVVLSFLIARLVIWILTQLILYRVYKEKSINVGRQYAINQLLKYVVYIIAFIVSLQYLGINMTLIIGGAAALLVGIGLGLQQTFNDFFSGLVLLFERSVAVGDILEFDGTVGKVMQIGLRSSLIETRNSSTMVVPNSVLVNQKVDNWTHFSYDVRFEIKLGVAYGADTKKVKEILLNIANDNAYVMKDPPPFVRFNDFGESSLDFTLYFFSRIYMNIGDIKSNMRFQIIEQFNEEEISIPFPHRHVIIHEGKG